MGGEVRSTLRKAARGAAGKSGALPDASITPCREWQGAKSKGYGKVRVGGTTYQAHRYIYEQHRGPIPEGMFVCHTCDNPACVNLDHLFLGSHDDNMADMVAKGRAARRDTRGERNGNARLTDEDVAEIRSSGESNVAAGKRYGVTHQCISRIRLGGTWRHA